MARKLRFSSKHVFLTYPKCNLALQVIYDMLYTKLNSEHNNIKNYIISHELHEDGEFHRHCWLELSRAPERVDANFFALDGFNGNYQSMKLEDNCAKYVLKDGEYITSFTPAQLEEKVKRAMTKGSKSIDKHIIGQRLMNGDSLLSIVQDNPALMFELGKLRDNALLYKQLSSTAEPLTELKNEWIWGPTGSGKSKYVSDNFPDAYDHPREVYWDSYEFESTVVLSDVDETWEDVLWELKIWGDHYVFNGRIKHKPSLKMRPKRIIITSNYTIEEVLTRVFKRKNIKHDAMLIKAIQRRFKEIRLDYKYTHEDLAIFDGIDNYFANDDNKENVFDLFDDKDYTIMNPFL